MYLYISYHLIIISRSGCKIPTSFPSFYASQLSFSFHRSRGERPSLLKVRVGKYFNLLCVTLWRHRSLCIYITILVFNLQSCRKEWLYSVVIYNIINTLISFFSCDNSSAFITYSLNIDYYYCYCIIYYYYIQIILFWLYTVLLCVFEGL